MSIINSQFQSVMNTVSECGQSSVSEKPYIMVVLNPIDFNSSSNNFVIIQLVFLYLHIVPVTEMFPFKRIFKLNWFPFHSVNACLTCVQFWSLSMNTVHFMRSLLYHGLWMCVWLMCSVCLSPWIQFILHCLSFPLVCECVLWDLV